MKVTSDPAGIDRAMSAAGHSAAAAFDRDVRASITHRTGRTAANTRVVESTEGLMTTFAVVGPPQLAALEHGANVGARRGPHMAPQRPVARVAGRFGEHLGEALRAGR